MASECDSGNSSEIIFSSGNFDGHVEKCFEGAHEKNGIGKKIGKKKDSWRSTMKKTMRGKHVFPEG